MKINEYSKLIVKLIERTNIFKKNHSHNKSKSNS